MVYIIFPLEQTIQAFLDTLIDNMYQGIEKEKMNSALTQR